MSLLETNLKSSASSILVEKILEQGQRLRNSMVQAILNNDPFNQEILHNNPTATTNIERKHVKKTALKCTCKKVKNREFDDELDKYLRREHELLDEAFETNRSTSPVPIDSLLRSASSINPCHCKNICGICREYETKLISHSASASICSNGDSSLIVTTRQQSIQTKKPELKPKLTDLINLTKYVDSLKINIYSLKLNNAGHRKILSYTGGTVKNSQTPSTFFIEYSLPEFLTKNIQKPKSRVNSGLNHDKKVRYCTKIVDNDSVYFKQQKIHSVSNIHMLDLHTIHIQFSVSFRSAKQRLALKIGKASFNLGTLIENRFLSCEQELVLMNENAPVALGAIKVSVQLGCDKLYFGKEFIDAISCSKENTNLSESDSIHRDKPSKKSDNKQILPLYYTEEQTQQIAHVQNVQNVQINENKSERDEPINNIINLNEEINLLYALIFISEVQFTSSRIDSFIICRGFSREDTVTSRTVLNECNPNFNLYQIIPILLDENYVNRFRDNYILVEVWEQQTQDQLLGICKLPVHQFYVAYRNSLIVKYLTRSPHPVISVDWWEPVINPTTNCEVGQLRSIVALGTQTQIIHLEQNRNIKDCLVKNPKYSDDKCLNTPITTARASTTVITSNDSNDDVSNNGCTVRIDELQPETDNYDSNITEIYNKRPEIIESTSSNKVDASTQSNMDTNVKNSDDPQIVNQRELLSTFLEQLISVRDMPQPPPPQSLVRSQVETSTNTEECETNQPLTTENTENISTETFPPTAIQTSDTNVKQTSDLLESLQKALTNTNSNTKNEINQMNIDGDKICDRFKVHILIESALHLPSRKKCKSKRSKTKSPKQNEEILPSTYVTFKGVTEDINITQVVPKSTSPKWDFRCDIYLPTELLLNNQKRLIFKVWRKANGPNLQPNFQTDIVLGFAALDLTVLISGLPNVQGWFNIVDFTSKCNGQIKIHVNPLENLSKFLNFKRSFTPEKQKPEKTTVNRTQLSLKCPEPQSDITDDLAPSDSLSRALKRKFTELDEITQRLRQRLCAVTNDDDFADTNDLFEDEFERDLNTICDDDDFVIENEPTNIKTTSVIEMTENQPGCSSSNYPQYFPEIETTRSNTTSIISAINAAKEISQNSENGSTISESSEKDLTSTQGNNKLDSHLNEGKLKIDALLEKLTLLTNDSTAERKTNLSFTSRYVSGCSDSNPSVCNPNLKDSHTTEAGLVFNPHLFQEIFASNNSLLDETERTVQYSSLNNLVHDIPSSEVSEDSTSSSSTNISRSRQAPDGAGHMSNESQP